MITLQDIQIPEQPPLLILDINNLTKEQAEYLKIEHDKEAKDENL